MTDQKVTCNKCGAKILSSTAKEHGGYCARCTSWDSAASEAAWHGAYVGVIFGLGVLALGVWICLGVFNGQEERAKYTVAVVPLLGIWIVYKSIMDSISWFAKK